METLAGRRSDVDRNRRVAVISFANVDRQIVIGFIVIGVLRLLLRHHPFRFLPAECRNVVFIDIKHAGLNDAVAALRKELLEKGKQIRLIYTPVVFWVMSD